MNFGRLLTFSTDYTPGQRISVFLFLIRPSYQSTLPHPGVERVLFDVSHHLAQSTALTAPGAEEVFRYIRSHVVGSSEFRAGTGLDNAAADDPTERGNEASTGPLAQFAAHIA